MLVGVAYVHAHCSIACPLNAVGYMNVKKDRSTPEKIARKAFMVFYSSTLSR